MADGEECNQAVREKMAPAHGYHELGMHEDAWKTLDNLPPEDKADPIVILLRLDILLALQSAGGCGRARDGRVSSVAHHGQFLRQNRCGSHGIKRSRKSQRLASGWTAIAPAKGSLLV